jgi:hypothetical protein
MISLDEIMKRHGTDKVTGHSYAGPYEIHFNKFRRKPISLLEIGVGGYANPHSGGHSLRAWKEYFPEAQIYSFDITDKTSLMEDRIEIFVGSQGEPAFIDSLLAKTGELDLVIDDGSHICKHIIDNFNQIFPHVKPGGIYVVEDTQTSYWPELRGGSEKNTVDFFKDLAHGLNYREQPGYANHTYLDKNITSIHFYHNLVFVYKGDNSEESNVLKNNKK